MAKTLGPVGALVDDDGVWILDLEAHRGRRDDGVGLDRGPEGTIALSTLTAWRTTVDRMRRTETQRSRGRAPWPDPS
jgi:hypothetical protein